MNNTEVLNEYFIWEEKNLTDLNQNSLKNAEQDKCVTTTETKTNSTPNDWRDITDPKLRKKLQNREWKKANRNKLNAAGKVYRQLNKEKLSKKAKERYLKNKEKWSLRQKEYRKENVKKIKSSTKTYYESNKSRIQSKHKVYNELNKDKIKKQRQEYYQRNKRKILDYNQSYHENKLKSNTQYRLAYILRCRLRTALNKKYKAGHAVKDIGCSIEELKSYLESKFLPGMTWDNHTQNGWHIDHIKPLSMFDLTDRVQFLQACHYTNLQPLWAHDNLTKSDKYYEDHRLINGQSVAQASQVKHSPL